MREKKGNNKGALLQLLRVALGREENRPLPEGIDWDEVVFLSRWHNVSPLASDGLTKMGYGLPKLWQHDCRVIGISFAYYQMAAQSLAQIFESRGLTMIVFKGLSLTDNYPIPSHRGAGDIDIFVVDSNNQPASEKADEVLREFTEVGEMDDHHSHSYFKRMAVENHYWLTTRSYGFDANFQAMEQTMRRLISEGHTLSDCYAPVHVPPATFSALYLMQHIYQHSYNVLKLRHVIDWMLFVENHYDEVDWTMVEESWQSCGMTDFVCMLHCFLIKRLGMKPEFCRLRFDDENSARVIEKIIFFQLYFGDNHLKKAINRYHHKIIIKPVTGNSAFANFCEMIKEGIAYLV